MKSKKLQRNIIFHLFQTSNIVQTTGDSFSKEISFKQWLLLMILINNKDKEFSLNELAGKISVTRQSAKKMIEILRKKEYVDVKSSGQDKRAYLITYNKNALEVYDSYKAEAFKAMDLLFKDISDEDLIVLDELLMKILENTKYEKDRL